MPLLKRGAASPIDLGDFAPDQDPATVGIVLDTQGVFPTMSGFQALPSSQPVIAAALPGVPVGSAIALYSSAFNNALQFWAGTKDHLYRAFEAGWVQADTLGASSFGATKWRYAQFNDDLIAVGGSGVTPQVATGPIGTYSPLIGGPPQSANLVLSVNGQVMMFVGPNWYASALGTDANWTPNIQTQANSGTLYDSPGDVVAAAQLYRNVVAFKQTGMWLGQYVGGAPVWSFVPISGSCGTWSQECVVALPDRLAFIGPDDFYTTTGYAPSRIPNRCKEWFFDIADPAQLSNASGRYDNANSCVYWYFVSVNAPHPGIPDRFVVWNTRVNRWGTGYLITPSVPSPNSYPGQTTGLYFDQNNILQTLTGSPQAGRIQTGWFGSASRRSQFQGVAPRWNVPPSRSSLNLYHANDTGQAPVAGSVATMATNGWFYGRQDDYYHFLQFNFQGVGVPLAPNATGGAELVAIEPLFRPSGIR